MDSQLRGGRRPRTGRQTVHHHVFRRSSVLKDAYPRGPRALLDVAHRQFRGRMERCHVDGLRSNDSHDRWYAAVYFLHTSLVRVVGVHVPTQEHVGNAIPCLVSQEVARECRVRRLRIEICPHGFSVSPGRRRRQTPTNSRHRDQVTPHFFGSCIRCGFAKKSWSLLSAIRRNRANGGSARVVVETHHRNTVCTSHCSPPRTRIANRHHAPVRVCSTTYNRSRVRYARLRTTCACCLSSERRTAPRDTGTCDTLHRAERNTRSAHNPRTRDHKAICNRTPVSSGADTRRPFASRIRCGIPPTRRR